MSNLHIITAHDSAKHYAEMAKVSKTYACTHGYSFLIRKLDDVKMRKPELLLEELEKGYDLTAWLDSDSIVVKPIPELFRDDYDIALCIKKQEDATYRYGRYVYSGFVIARQTAPARNILKMWSEHMVTPSDQHNLNDILDPDTSIYSKAGEIIEMQEARFLLLDPNIYCHVDSIMSMNAPEENVKLLHFKGRGLHNKWPEYAKKYL